MADPLHEALVEIMRPEIERIVNEIVAALDLAPSSSPWLTTKEAAEYLGVTTGAVHMRVRAGKLKAHYDAGNKLRFHRDDLDGSMRAWD